MVEGDAPSRWRVPVPAGYARGAPFPWWLKLGTKLALAGVGLHGPRARALGIAEPSFTTLEPGRLLDAPAMWMRHAQAVLGRRPRNLLELGPGRMVLRAPVLAGMGFGRIWYADPADSAPTAPGPYEEAARLASARGVAVPDLSGAADRGAVLARCDAALLTGGPDVLSAIPDGAVDLVVSEVVLEHVRREDLAPLLSQLRRVTAPDGLGLHWVDFHDHLGGGLQHLRFSDAFWASPLAGRAGIYVNRLGLSALVSRFRRAGFAVAVPHVMAWAERPPGPSRPHPDATRPAADDLVCHAMLQVRPEQRGP
jgi:SAM-dependent methyltransferase